MNKAAEWQRPDQGPDPNPEQMLALLRAEQARVEQALVPDGRLVFGLWGVAWLVGFLVFWSGASDSAPVQIAPAVAGVVFGCCLAAAAIITTVHIVRRTVGVRGPSSLGGAMYGWTWFIAFACLYAVMTAAYRQGLDDETAGLLWPGLSALIVGCMYMAGGALWLDRVQFGLGLWVLLSGGAGALAGFPSIYLVMGLAGGGGFLAAAVWAAVHHPHEEPA